MRKVALSNSNMVLLFRVTVDVLNSPMMHFSKHNKKLISKDKVIWREIAMLGSHSLYKLARTIVDSFGLDFDHCFGFYRPANIKFLSEAKEMYEFFTDIDEDPNPVARPVKPTKISSVFLKVGEDALFYFDYGDSWHFNVCLQEFLPVTSYRKYPQIVQKFSGDLEQYPVFD